MSSNSAKRKSGANTASASENEEHEKDYNAKRKKLGNRDFSKFWSCMKCTLLNPTTTASCTLCGCNRPEGTAIWTCKACTFRNYNSSPNCAMCGTKSSDTIPISAESSTSHSIMCSSEAKDVSLDSMPALIDLIDARCAKVVSAFT